MHHFAPACVAPLLESAHYTTGAIKTSLTLLLLWCVHARPQFAANESLADGFGRPLEGSKAEFWTLNVQNSLNGVSIR